LVAVRPVSILHVETNLGLRPGGVERLGSQLLDVEAIVAVRP
jgi:hypothetical protein